MGQRALWLLALFLLLIAPDAPAIVAFDGADVALSPEVAAAAGRRICDLAVQGARQLFWVTTRASALAMFGDEPRARVLQLGRDWRGAAVVEEEGASHVP